MAYLVSSGACIGAIACLSQQSTARVGNALGLIGVSGGIAATLGAVGGDAGTYAQIAGARCPSWKPCVGVEASQPSALCLSVRRRVLVWARSGLGLPWCLPDVSAGAGWGLASACCLAEGG